MIKPIQEKIKNIIKNKDLPIFLGNAPTVQKNNYLLLSISQNNQNYNMFCDFTLTFIMNKTIYPSEKFDIIYKVFTSLQQDDSIHSINFDSLKNTCYGVINYMEI